MLKCGVVLASLAAVAGVFGCENLSTSVRLGLTAIGLTSIGFAVAGRWRLR